MKTIEIMKKNLKYFKVSINGYECKLLIDAASENLPMGTQTLELEDISVVTKYGKDVIYKLKVNESGKIPNGICTLKSELFNKVLVSKCKELGGTWDADSKSWVFSSIVEKEVEELDAKYNSIKVPIEITCINKIQGHPSVTMAGFELAVAFGRDSGAKIKSGVSVIEGGFSSGGSIKNWYCALRQGSKLRMNFPIKLLGEIEDCYRYVVLD